MSDLFHVINEGQVILRSKGTYFQKKLYYRGDRLYAAWGSGFIRLGSGDATSNPNVSWESIDAPFALCVGPMKAPIMPAVRVVQKEAA